MRSKFKREAGTRRITIENWGEGFDPVEVKVETGSFGLQIRREHIEIVGGSLQNETAPGQGTRIIISYKKL